MIETILESVAQVYSITTDQIKSKSRVEPIPEARRMAVFFMKAKGVDNNLAVQSVNRNRVFIYRAIEKVIDEIYLYSDVEAKHSQIQQLIENKLNN